MFSCFKAKNVTIVSIERNNSVKKEKLIILFSSLFSFITSLILLIVMSIPSFGGKELLFKSTYKNDEVTLSATYHEKKDVKYIALICQGYSCDRAKWRAMSNVFLTNNMSVMTFDYSGQGNSRKKRTIDFTETNSLESKITVGVASGILYSYQIYSVKFASYLSSSIKSITGSSSSYSPNLVSFTYISWGLSLLGIVLLFFGLSIGEKAKLALELKEIPVIDNEKKFLISKLILWLPGLSIGLLICCLCIVMPFGSPIMNIPYMCCIAGYGIAMLILYLIKKEKGVNGSFPKPDFKKRTL